MSQTSIVLLFAFVLPLFAREGSAEKASDSAAPSSDCLVLLKSPDADFETTKPMQGATVLAHSSSNANWLVRPKDGDCSALRKASAVASVETPTGVIVSLNDGDALPQTEIEALGGIVTHTFQNISAASIVLPASKVTELTAIPAIKRVRKDHSVSATGSMK